MRWFKLGLILFGSLLALSITALIGYMYGLTNVNTHEYYSQAKGVYTDKDIELALDLFGAEEICIAFGEGLLGQRIRRKDQLEARISRAMIRTALKFRTPEYCARGAFVLSHHSNPWADAPSCQKVERYSPRDIACRVGTFPGGAAGMMALPATPE